ncbi:abscisic acid receptor PYR1-like [Cynara cardunculus var. scolymus]|uniref:Polyketide cyclase/dehydrase n=1 Tax=Cynara cardunculus var. scolymus TaxID=59895 RepID=A0A124SCX8_CYNCS|nr:abscisic acid receptor PYR1-like [Cynara cardunculus var. scolymus]KVH95201.1 Polyketide cyclase/dehydrase [Cynara cardunculus var. scolymus]
MEKGDTSSTAEEDKPPPPLPPQTITTTTTHHLSAPPGLTEDEFSELKPHVIDFHTYHLTSSQCSSLLAQHIHAPLAVVWSVVRRFDKPQTYKHFIKSCTVTEGFTMAVGCTRDVNVISGLPAATSTERLDLLDDQNHVMGFTIIGGEHRLRNYHAVTTVHEITTAENARPMTVVLESYVVDVPEGNTEEDTRLFADTVVKLNLQKLASVTEAMAHDADATVKILRSGPSSYDCFKLCKTKPLELYGFAIDFIGFVELVDGSPNG